MATLLIVFFISFSLVAQFKAGALMLITLLNNVPIFQTGRQWLSGVIEGVPLVGAVEPGYLLCLILFALLVISYTSYGGTVTVGIAILLCALLCIEANSERINQILPISYLETTV
jgi:hypothetical protein